MKTLLLMLLAGVAAFVTTTAQGVDRTLPADVESYYRDFNELTLRELQPPKHGWTSFEKFTLQVPQPEVHTIEILRQRIQERQSEIDPKFHRSLRVRSPHEQVLLRITKVRKTGDLLAVQCAIYQPPALLPEVAGDLQVATVISDLDFSRMKLLRQETHQWRRVNSEWVLHGTIVNLSKLATRSF